uniref:phage tail protein n=1 Tax=Hafnia alvei TaxID=569 RepID=UPI002431A29D|nr:phage tail protein [Hafnia alvei]
MTYKNLLLQPNNATISLTLLGQPVHIRRLSAQDMLDYSAQIDDERAQGGNSAQLAKAGVALIIRALVNADGSRPDNADLPTPEAILQVHSQADIMQALTTVQRHSYGTLEEAEKN